MASDQKKSKHDAFAGGDAVSALPLACVQHIIYYASDQRVANLILHEADMPDGHFLKHTAQVCKTWADLSARILLERQIMSLRINIRSGSNIEMEAAVQQMKLRGPKLKDLQLAMFADHDLEVDNEQEDMETTVINWDAIFKHCTSLWRLDLSRVPLHSKHLKAVIEAAANYCNEIQSLVLPRKEHSRNDTQTGLQNTFVSLYSALQKWYSHGGLRQLTVPQRCEEPSSKFPEYTDEYLTAVSNYSPNLEYFDGWSVTYEETEYIECEELLFCNNSAWSEFCRGCPKLREVNWFTIPYAGDFFRTFAKHKKLWLTNLTLAGGPPEKWSEELADGSYYADGAFEHTKEDVVAVLEACPALETLSILFYNSENDVMQHEDFDDEFLIRLAQKCQHLRVFRYDELESGQPICENRVITDIGLGALAAMPNLSLIAVEQVFSLL
uniref:F-box domain-containing protein n=1 Tax=Globisporangium ultimum (strain ATCC 200006 / CBS 805.95 / DAOM BR144) TaxID=431595 RepID=K3W9Q1_GLOUD